MNKNFLIVLLLASTIAACASKDAQRIPNNTAMTTENSVSLDKSSEVFLDVAGGKKIVEKQQILSTKVLKVIGCNQQVQSVDERYGAYSNKVCSLAGKETINHSTDNHRYEIYPTITREVRYRNYLVEQTTNRNGYVKSEKIVEGSFSGELTKTENKIERVYVCTFSHSDDQAELNLRKICNNLAN